MWTDIPMLVLYFVVFFPLVAVAVIYSLGVVMSAVLFIYTRLAAVYQFIRHDML